MKSQQSEIHNAQEIIVSVQKLARSLDELHQKIEHERQYFAHSIPETNYNSPEYYLLFGAYLTLRSLSKGKSSIDCVIPIEVIEVAKKHFPHENKTVN